MELVVRTIYGSRLQTLLMSKLPFSVDQNTTLNEKFSVNAGVLPSSGVYPAAQYYCIGNGGHTASSGTGGIALNEAVQHLPTDAGLYSFLPFVLRATNNDIDNTTQQKYALRKQVTYNGNTYFAYYLKRIPVDAAVVTTTLQTTTNGVTTSSGFTPGPSNLSPTPPVLDQNNVNLLTGQYANVSAPLPLVLTADEITEILNAAEIIYGDSNYAIISEIGIVSAVDHPITLPNNNPFNEAICAQIVSFVSTIHLLQFAASGINGNFNIGTNEPMLVVEGA
jgi:hypothetical protein